MGVAGVREGDREREEDGEEKEKGEKASLSKTRGSPAFSTGESRVFLHSGVSPATPFFLPSFSH